MNKPTPARLAAAALMIASAALALPAHAHYLWLEQGAKTSRLYFGEYEERLHERSPGRLDEMPAPEIRAVDRSGKLSGLDAVRGTDGFTFPMPQGSSGIVAEETGYAVKDWTRYGIGVVKPMFYARLLTGPAPVAPVLPLDIVPTGKASEFRVVFRGAPLAGVDVRIVAPNTWSREERTGQDGTVRVSYPWRGQYILQVVHKESVEGVFGNQRFEAVRHRMTATLSVRNGAATSVPAQWEASKMD